MGLGTIILFGLGLSADAASVSICEGLRLKKKNLALALKLAALFGFFQMLMLILGFYIGDLFVRIPFLSPVVGWVAFGLLLYVSIKMFCEALEEGGECSCCEAPKNNRELFLLAVATSIDSMTVGLTLASDNPALINASADLNVLLAAAIVGGVTALVCFLAVRLGARLGSLLGNKAELFGSILLFLLSIKVLLSNCGVDLHF